MRTKKFGLAAASTAAVAALLIGGATLANAADNPTPTTSATTSSAAAVPGDAATGKGGPQGASQDTPVTGDEAQKVIDAVKAEDSSATIDTVRKDPDGSYDALGTTSDGAKVMFEVSADLATITQGQGGQGGQGGPRGQATGGSTTGGSGAAANGTAGTATPTLPSN